MITVTKQDNGVLFTFENSDKYLYGSGTIEVPFNSLSIIQDESDMISLRKAASNDIFLAARYDTDFGYSSKEEAVEALKGMLFAETGGGSGSGVTPSEVQEMIDESVSGKADTAVVNQAISEATAAILSVSGDVQTNAENISGIWDTIDEKEEVIASALTEVRQDVADIDAKEEVIASALTEVRQNKQDKLEYYSENTEDGTAMINVESELPILTMSTSAADGTNDLIELDRRVILNDNKDDGSGNTSDASIIIDNGEISFDVTKQENGETNHTYMLVNPTGVTINDERVLTESDGAYYISFATIATTGIRDEDWDGIVAAIDAHRPIYAGYPRNDGGILYYGVECMNKNVTNTEIVMTASDNSQHYFYTFTKNGSNDYSYTVSTKPYVTDAEKATWNAKQDALSAGTGIEISGNVISATGGGGATYSAGTNISIDTANTINCTLPISAGTGEYSLSIGNNGYGVSQVSGNYAVSVNGGGYHPNTVRGNNSFAANMDNQAIGEGSFANGQICIANGKFSHAEGAQCTANTYGSHAEGSYVITNNNYEHSQGKYNVSNSGSTESGQTLFSVGNGTSTSARHNAFEIRQNGDIYFPDTDNTTYQNFYEKPMVRLQDMYAALGGLKFVKLSQSEYDALPTKDSSTLYIISNVVS